MKTIKSSICAAALLLSTPAMAAADYHPYVGFDLQRYLTSYGIEDLGGGLAIDDNAILEDSLNGLNIHAGVRPHENFGAEIGLFRTEEGTRNIPAGAALGPGVIAAAPFQTKVRMQGVTLDGLGYLPVAENVTLIGTAGVSYSKAEAEIIIPAVGTESVDDSEFGFRVGTGAQYDWQNANVRGIVRYQTADFDDTLDNFWIWSIGVNYKF